jgi:hypothetical protein
VQAQVVIPSELLESWVEVRDGGRAPLEVRGKVAEQRSGDRVVGVSVGPGGRGGQGFGGGSEAAINTRRGGGRCERCLERS